MASTASSNPSSQRRPPLHTCGVVVLMIAHSTYTRSQDLNGPLGSITRKLSKFEKLASPIICALRYQWLVMLSFSDDCILAIESTIETIFPQSSHVFNKIDKLVQFTENLPGKFDDVMEKFTMSEDQVPLLDWARVNVISWLNFCSTKLTHWRFEEKDIMMDSNSKECNMESTSSSAGYRESSIPVGFESKGKFSPTSESLPTTYKEALEKGSRKENEEMRKDDRVDCCSKANAREDEKGLKDNKTEKTKKEDHVFEEEAEKGEKMGLDHQAYQHVTRSDPILEMFESGWLTKSSKEAKEHRLTLSASFRG